MIATDTKPTESMKKTSESVQAENFRPVEVFVLAGARSSGDALAEAHGVPSKAHIQVAGQSMISRVLNVVGRSVRTDTITIIGIKDHESLQNAEDWPSVNIAPGAEGPAASVLRANWLVSKAKTF